MSDSPSRRSFLQSATLTSFALAAGGTILRAAEAPNEKILGEAGVKSAERPKGPWQPISDRKIRVGIAGYGVCQFGAAFGFQDHPNVAVVAVSDLFPERCAALARACRCERQYPSLEE